MKIFIFTYATTFSKDTQTHECTTDSVSKWVDMYIYIYSLRLY